MLFFSIFNTSNHKNTPIIKMLNAKYFSIQLHRSLIFDTLLQQDVRIFFIVLSLSLLCGMPLHCFPLSVFLLLYASFHCWVDSMVLIQMLLSSGEKSTFLPLRSMMLTKLEELASEPLAWNMVSVKEVLLVIWWSFLAPKY